MRAQLRESFKRIDGLKADVAAADRQMEQMLLHAFRCTDCRKSTAEELAAWLRNTDRTSRPTA